MNIFDSFFSIILQNFFKLQLLESPLVLGAGRGPSPTLPPFLMRSSLNHLSPLSVLLFFNCFHFSCVSTNLYKSQTRSSHFEFFQICHVTSSSLDGVWTESISNTADSAQYWKRGMVRNEHTQHNTGH